MSPFTFRAAKRESVALLVGLAGGTGSGKTWSSMLLAKGMAGDKPFAVVDTENGRSRHYADAFRFDAGDLRAPFAPEKYMDAIKAADEAGYPVIVVDSASHEHAGEGGLLDQHEAELTRMAGDDWKRRDACNMAAWIRPKASHKAMVNKLLQVRAHVILCFRAEPKIEMVRGGDGKMEIREKKSLVGLNGWIPISEKNLPFELTASFLLMADRPGVPLPIKCQSQHRALFPPDKPITEECGRALAVWAAGGTAPSIAAPPPNLIREVPGNGKPISFAGWLAAIQAAGSIEALKQAAKDLRAANLKATADERAALKVALEQRMAALTAPREAGEDD